VGRVASIAHLFHISLMKNTKYLFVRVINICIPLIFDGQCIQSTLGDFISELICLEVEGVAVRLNQETQENVDDGRNLSHIMADDGPVVMPADRVGLRLNAVILLCVRRIEG
jgi:hypothetical protein